jgi:hypothetical protein
MPQNRTNSMMECEQTWLAALTDTGLIRVLACCLPYCFAWLLLEFTHGLRFPA